MSFVINPKYTFLTDFVRQLEIPGNFFKMDSCTILHDGRNKIALYDIEGVKIVVKSFGHISLPNKIIYGRFRKSKAQRAYEFAVKLKQAGISTPEEVAYIEVRRGGLLSESFYISLYTDYKSMLPLFYKRTLTPEEFSHITPLLDSLSQFLHKVHQAGVLHNDLNYTNILYKELPGAGKTDVSLNSAPGTSGAASGNGSDVISYVASDNSSDIVVGNGKKGRQDYDFTLIDINRMEFRKELSLKERIHNLRRLNVSIPAHIYIMERYASLLGIDPRMVQLHLIDLRYKFEYKRRRRDKIKAFIRGKKLQD